MLVNPFLSIVKFSMLTKGSRHMEGESPPTYGGIHFLRFGDEIILVTAFVSTYNEYSQYTLSARKTVICKHVLLFVSQTLRNYI